MKNKTGMFMLMFFALLILLAGCNSDETNSTSSAADDNENGNENPEEEVTLRISWWGGEDRHDRTMEVIGLFEEKFPHITVQPEFTGWNNYWERLNTQAVGGNLPHVIQIDNSKVNELNSNNLLIDLAPLINDGTIDLSNVDDVHQDMNTDENKVWAISLGSNALSAVYNQDLFDEHGIELEPGYTYEDLYKAMMKIKETAGEDFYGFDLSTQELSLFTIFARQNGEAFYNEEGTGLGFEDQTFIDFLTYIKKLIDNGVAPPRQISLEQVDGGGALVQTGAAASSINPSNSIISFSKGSEDNLGVGLLPSLEGGEHGNWIRPSQSFSITSNSEEKEKIAAAQFINFITNSLEANEILLAERGVPISSEVREHLYTMVEDEEQQTFEYLEEVADYTSPAPQLPPPGEAEVSGSFSRVIEEFEYGQITAEEAAERFRSEAEAVLSQN